MNTFPNLQNEKIIGLDIETYDPDIDELGPGPRRPDTYILGIGISVRKDSWYFPIGHKTDNLPKEKVLSWVKDTVKDKLCIGANLSYDFDYLQNYDIRCKSVLDVQIAEALLDEESRSYSLDNLGAKYCGERKAKTEIEKFCEDRGLKGDPRKHLYLMPAETVGKYCRKDCTLSEAVFAKQLPIMQEQQLMQVFELETELIPLLLLMRKIGIRMDVQKLQMLSGVYAKEERQFQEKINRLAGCKLNVKSNKQIDELFKRKGYARHFTAKENPSYDKIYLALQDNEESRTILNVREYRDIKTTFIEGIQRFLVGGRLHTLFMSVARDDGGTVTGRLSSQKPNLQNIPSHEPHKENIRSCFLAEDGHILNKIDYAQIEYRGYSHYARGRGAEDLRKTYKENPYIDYHTMCASMIYGVTPEKVTKEQRKNVKTINFGIMYGMGAYKLSRSLGILTAAEPPGMPQGDWKKMKEWEEKNVSAYPEFFEQLNAGREIINTYHNNLPSLKHTFKYAADLAQNRGYVKTILGRRRRLKYGFHRALNAVVQGTAADIMKMAMLKSFKAGLFNGVLKPHLTVHDELVFSRPDTHEGEQARDELKHIFETAIELSVPLIADMQEGRSWGECKKVVNE